MHVPGVGYVSYAGMEPLSTWIGMASDFINRAAELPQANAESLLYTLTIAAGDNMFSKRYVQGFSDWIKAITSPNVTEQVEALRNRLALPVPFQGTLGVIRRGYTDPTVKDARDLLDRYLSFLPGGSSLVPPRRNIITGEPIRYEGAWGPDFISIRSSKRRYSRGEITERSLCRR